MAIEPVAAERTWFAVAPDGTEHGLSIGVPTDASGGEWRAAVSLGALESRTHAIAGIDPSLIDRLRSEIVAVIRRRANEANRLLHSHIEASKAEVWKITLHRLYTTRS